MSRPKPDLATLRAWDIAHVWHPFTPLADWAASSPLVIESAEGNYLIDTDGNRYLDGVSSLWCNVHGHKHPALNAAIRDQLEKVAHSTLLGLTHPTAIELAHRLVELAPEGLTRVFFSDDGATAVEVALKMAFQYWRQKPDPEPKRTQFIALSDAYHGDTLGDVSIGGVDRFHTMFSPILFPALRAPSPHCYRCPLNLEQADCGMACLGELEKLLIAHRGEVVAVIVEPLVQGAAGIIVHPPGYLKGVRDLTRKYDTLLIADEVAVGFGRTGTLFACEQEDVVPDLLCLAKGLTGGYLPLAATLTNETIYAAFYGRAIDGKTFYHGHTFGGNPLGAAVALASLQVFEDEATLDNLRPKIAYLAKWLAEMAEHPAVGDVRQRGLMAGVEIVANKATKAPFPSELGLGADICRRARAHGLIIRPLGDVLVIMPPLSITIEQLETMLFAIRQSLDEALQGVPA